MSDLVVVFDIDNTLYDQLLPFKEAVRKLLPELTQDTLQLHKLSRIYSDEVFPLVQSGKISSKEGNIYRIKRAASDLGLEISDQLAHDFQQLYQNGQSEITLRPEMELALDWCYKKDIKLGVLTNGGSSHQWKKVKTLKLENWIPTENIIASGDIGTAKPDPKIFLELEKRLSIEKKNIYYVGDSYENDVEGALRVGWKVIWLDVYGDGVPEESSYRADYVLRPGESLVEVLKIL